MSAIEERFDEIVNKLSERELTVITSAVGVVAALVLLISLVVTTLAVARGLWRRSDLVQPTAYRVQWIRENPVPKGSFAPDLAWPEHFIHQLAVDRRCVNRECRRLYRRLWRLTRIPRRSGLVALIWTASLPLVLVVALVLAMAGIVLVTLMTTLALCGWLCAAFVLLFFVPTLGVLRVGERLWTSSRGTAASCPKCFYVSERPAYVCPNAACGWLHRDIRPGRLGLLARRCACGVLMPTMVLRAAWRLEARCQSCEETLSYGAAAVRDVRVPIFGEVSAGKTRFLYAALGSLRAAGERDGPKITFPDERSRQSAERGLKMIQGSRDTIKTTADLPRALSAQIGRGATATLLHMFDAAGECYRSTADQHELRYLDTGHGLVYVLDPFAIAEVRNRLTGHNAAALRLAHASSADPEGAYSDVVTRLRGGGVRPATQRLAVVVSKADLLAAFGFDFPRESSELADWLYSVGMHNIVLAARQEFADARYFAVASLSSEEFASDLDPAAPLRWLLAAHGLKLPVPLRVEST